MIYSHFMKKETVIAISLGIVAGISIAGVVIVNSRNSSGKGNDILFSDVSPTLSVDTAETTPLLITSPDNESVTDAQTTTIKGTAPENAFVIIQSPLEEFSIKLSSTTFSQPMKLMPGENIIRITSYDKKIVDSRTVTIYSFPQK